MRAPVISKPVNALVEAGLVTASLVGALAGLGLSWWGCGAAAGLAWWLFVHAHHLVTMLRENTVKAVGTTVFTLLVLGFGHGLAYGFGLALRTLVGFS